MDIGFWPADLEGAVFPDGQGIAPRGSLGRDSHKYKRVVFSRGVVSNSSSFICFTFTTMPSFDAHAFGLLIALAMATVALVISIRVVPVVRVVLVRNTPTRARRR